jgi:hypothetical protein
VLRCLYAKKLMNTLDQGVRVINIDETWLSSTDFRNRKWCVKGANNSIPAKSLSPRISMIVALSSLGEVYCALT